MPALPAFESNVTLEKIGTRPVQDPASRGAPIQEPMSVLRRDEQSSSPPVIKIPGPQNPSGPQLPPMGPGGPTAGPTGFGENTLLWMAPPKLPTDPGAAVGSRP